MMRAGRQRPDARLFENAPCDTLKFERQRPAIKHLKVNVREVNWFSTYHVHHQVTEHPAPSR
jgi:hypothetical protein